MRRAVRVEVKLEDTTEYRTFRSIMRPVRKPRAYFWIYPRACDVETGEIHMSRMLGTQPKWEGWDKMPEFIKIGQTRGENG